MNQTIHLASRRRRADILSGTFPAGCRRIIRTSAPLLRRGRSRRSRGGRCRRAATGARAQQGQPEQQARRAQPGWPELPERSGNGLGRGDRLRRNGSLGRVAGTAVDAATLSFHHSLHGAVAGTSAANAMPVNASATAAIVASVRYVFMVFSFVFLSSIQFLLVRSPM